MISKGARNDVLMGFVHNGNVAACFMHSMLGAFAHESRKDPKQRRMVEYHDTYGPYIHDNRARLVKYFLETTNFQWLWMLDNDMEFPEDSLDQLLAASEEHDIQLLGAAYYNQYSKIGPRLSWLAFTPDGIKSLGILPENDEPVSVTAVGMGCTLVHRDVLQAVADAHVNDPWDTFGADILLRYEDGGILVGSAVSDFEGQLQEGRKIADWVRMGEDVTFCIRAQMAGYTTYGLPSLVVEHYKPHFMAHGGREIEEEVGSASVS